MLAQLYGMRGVKVMLREEGVVMRGEEHWKIRMRENEVGMRRGG